MSNRFLTHFSTITLFHLLVLLGSWQLVQSELVRRPLNLGPTVLKLQVASEVLRPTPLPQHKPSQKVISAPKSAPVTEQVVETTAAPSTPNTTEQNDIRDRYKSELRAKIEQNKYYPPASRRLGQTGTVVVAFTLLEDGHIINVRIDTPSRYDRLNESALDAVKKVHVFRPIPKELGESQMDIKVPVKFFTI
jgi:periplasmic protein TonB